MSDADLTLPPMERWAARIRRFLMPDDELLIDAGASGELLVAKIRLVVAIVLLAIPLSNALLQPTGLTSESLVGLSMTAFTVAVAGIIYVFVRRDRYVPWLGFATSIMDVSAVSMTLAVFLVIGQPHTAVNSKVVFEAYFLALMATCLRYDVRICLTAGALVVVQYLAIVLVATHLYDMNAPRWAPFVYGSFSWTAQVNRLILLVAATVLSAAIVVRARDLRQLSTLDRLTGLANRGFLDERISAELSRRSRSQQPLAVVMLDVDHFKTFNDRYGHAAGDAALRALAGVLRRTLRRSDLVARYGGEEFVLLLPETGPAAAFETVDALRRTINQTPVRLNRTELAPPLTVSCGIATCPDDGETGDVLLAAADARLFHAKNFGRNMVVSALHRSITTYSSGEVLVQR